MNKQIEKKIVSFDVGDILPIGLTLVVVGVAIAYGLEVMGDIKDDTCRSDGFYPNAGSCYHNASFVSVRGTAHYNATRDSISGVSKLPEKMPLIATVVVAAIVLGIVLRFTALSR